MSGTAISTPEGIRTVESLSAGELVLTESGVAKPIGKVVKTAFERSESRDYRDALKPVRIRRDAFGEGLPHSDLYLSPSHCVFVDGVLIPVEHLINGHTIAWVARQELIDSGIGELAYYHIELEEHDVVVAEGLPCETLWLEESGKAPYAPILENSGNIAEIRSRLRSSVSPLVDTRNRLELIRDQLHDRAYLLRAA